MGVVGGLRGIENMTDQALDQEPPVSHPQPPVSSPGGGQFVDFEDAFEPRIEGYKTQSLLGRGGMGTVWEAVQLSTKRPVALKLMNPATLLSEKARSRFEREVELAAGLDHSHIARVYDSGLDRGVYFYVMELVRGVPLDYKYVKRRGLSKRQIAQLMCLVCDAVQHAHQRGVMHRDLKPSNVLVTEEGQPCVVDFGLAKTLYESKEGMEVSLAGDVPGTVAFMSPEQAMGDEKRIDTRTDVYALGVMLYGLLLDGRHPHDLTGGDFQDRQRIVQEEVRRPRHVNKAIDPELEAVLLKALAKAPEQRYGSAGELARDLERFLCGDPLIARRPTVTYFLRRHLVKYRVPVAIATLVILGVLSMVVIGYLRERQLRQVALHKAEVNRQALYFNRIALVQANLRQGHVTQAVQLLDACPADLRHWEWFYLWYATDQSVQTRRHHPSSYVAVTLSSDGSQVAAADDGEIKIWDSRSGSVQAIPVAGAQALAFGADSRQLAYVDHLGMTQLWSFTSGELDNGLKGLGKDIKALAFSDDSHHIVSGGRRTTQSLGFQGRSMLKQEGLVCLWHRDSDEPVLTLHLDRTVHAVAYDTQRNRVAIGGWGGIEIRDVAPGAPAYLLEGDGLALAFSPDGHHLVSGGGDGIISLWDISRQAVIGTYQGHRQPVGSIIFNEAGDQFISASLDGTVKVWNAQPAVPSFHTGRDYLALSKDGRTIAVMGPNQRLQLLDGASGHVIKTLPLTQAYLDRAAFSPDGRHMMTMSSLSTTTLQIWQLPSGRHLRDLSVNVRDAVFSGDGRYLATMWLDQISLWDLDSDAEPIQLTGHEGSIRAAAFSGDGQFIVSAGDDKTIRIWDVASGVVIKTLKDHPSNITRVAFVANDQRILSVDLDETIRLSDMTTGMQLNELRPHPRIHALALSDDGRWLATGGYGQIKITDLRTGHAWLSLRGHEEFLGALAFSADGKRLVSGGDDATVKLWDVASGTEIMTLVGHASAVSRISFTSDESIVSVGEDGLVIRWQTPMTLSR